MSQRRDGSGSWGGKGSPVCLRIGCWTGWSCVTERKRKTNRLGRKRALAFSRANCLPSFGRRTSLERDTSARCDCKACYSATLRAMARLNVW